MRGWAQGPAKDNGLLGFLFVLAVGCLGVSLCRGFDFVMLLWWGDRKIQLHKAGEVGGTEGVIMVHPACPSKTRPVIVACRQTSKETHTYEQKIIDLYQDIMLIPSWS